MQGDHHTQKNSSKKDHLSTTMTPVAVHFIPTEAQVDGLLQGLEDEEE